MKTVYKRLKEARKKAKYTQEQIAIKLNTSRSTISKYENGKLEPNLQMIKDMIKYYNTSADYIFNIEKKEKEEITDEEKELITDWRKLSEINKNAIKTTIKAFLENENIKEEKKSAV